MLCINYTINFLNILFITYRHINNAHVNNHNVQRDICFNFGANFFKTEKQNITQSFSNVKILAAL